MSCATKRVSASCPLRSSERVAYRRLTVQSQQARGGAPQGAATCAVGCLQPSEAAAFGARPCPARCRRAGGRISRCGAGRKPARPGSNPDQGIRSRLQWARRAANKAHNRVAARRLLPAQRLERRLKTRTPLRNADAKCASARDAGRRRNAEAQFAIHSWPAIDSARMGVARARFLSHCRQPIPRWAARGAR